MKDSTRKILKSLKIVLWSILGIILLFIFIVVGTLLVDKYINKSSVPMFAGYSPLIVTTGSMSGTIEVGDMVIVKRTDDYKLGDIVTYIEAEGKTPVTHRLVNYGPEEGTFIAKGDANNSTDIFPISVDQIAGVVVLTIPKIGLFFDWFLHDFGFIYALALVAIVVAAVYFWNMFKGEPEKEADSQSNAPKAQSDNPAATNADVVQPEDQRPQNDK